jgi:AcrR family transcriptional regulator
MTRTPWGDSEQLRARKLAPGYRLPPESVARNQRWRLLAAMVAAVEERGYERTTVADVVERSGVSRTAFYRHFENREQCFVTAVDAILDFSLAGVEAAYEAAADKTWDERLIAALETLIEQVVEQPAAARVSMLEVYVAGREAVDHADRGAVAFEEMLEEGYGESPEHAGLPPSVLRGIVGGVRKVIAGHAVRGEEQRLPEIRPQLSEWARSYRAPAVPLRRPRVRAAPRGAARFVVHDHLERIFAAMASVTAEKGYGATTLDDVAERASTSFSTFYNYFRTKEDAFLAAYDTGVAQAYAAALPPFERAPDWPHAIRAAIDGFLGYLAAEPDWARGGIVEVLAVGRRGMERRDRAVDMFATMLEPGFELAPDVPAIAREAIGGAVYELLYHHIRRRGPERLMELVPVATFMALAPFVGPNEAAAVANERSPRRSRARS